MSEPIIYSPSRTRVPFLDVDGNITLNDSKVINLKAGTTSINPEIAHRGQFYFAEGTSGVADLFYCIMKGSSNAYTAIQLSIG